MSAQNATAPRQGSSQATLFQTVANCTADSGESGALMVDGAGRIRRSGKDVADLFGANQVRMIGKRISEFIAGLFLEGNSPSYNARYLAYLCADGEWRRFVAKNTRGQEFAIEISLSRKITEGQEVFVLNFRQPGEASCR